MKKRLMIMAATLMIMLYSQLSAAWVIPYTPLMPMVSGKWAEFKASDNFGNRWTARIAVLEQATLQLTKQIPPSDFRDYYHIRMTNWNYQGEVVTKWLRSTDTEVYEYIDGAEYLVFQNQGSGTLWSYPLYNQVQQVGEVYNLIMPVETVTVPKGGPFQALVTRSNFRDNNSLDSPYWYYYLVPNLGIIKYVNYAVTTGNGPVVQELARFGPVQPPLGLLLGD